MKGHYDGDDLARYEELGIDVVVACQDKITRKDRDKGFHAESFIYDKATDSYTCPANEVLTLHSKPTSKIKKYHNTKACRRCEHKDTCVAKNSNICSIHGFDEIMATLDRLAQKSARKLLSFSILLLKKWSTANFRANVGKLGYSGASVLRTA